MFRFYITFLSLKLTNIMNVLVGVSKVRQIRTSMPAVHKNLNISCVISRPVVYHGQMK